MLTAPSANGTRASDFAFTPKVWQDHVQAYFNKKLVWGALAMRDNTLQGKPGMTVNMPYFKAIGAAEEPLATAALAVDKIQDDSFSATIKEVGKAVGITKSALRASAATQDRIFQEVAEQIARVHAEKVDADLLTEVSQSGSSSVGYLAGVAGDVMTVRVLNEGKIVGFGDKHDQAVAVYMHSLQLLSLLNDTTAGFLKADANDPMYHVPGFQGRLFGMALITCDTVPEVGGGIGGKKAYDAFVMKANPYGLLTAAEPMIESDYDLLNREYIFAATQWYACKSFHGKIAALDKRVVKITTTTSISV